MGWSFLRRSVFFFKGGRYLFRDLEKNNNLREMDVTIL